MIRRGPILLVLAAALPGVAQDVSPAPDSTWWAIIGMGSVLLLAWCITRWVVRPFLVQFNDTEEGVERGTAPSPTDPEQGPVQDSAGEQIESCLRSGDLELNLLARKARVENQEVPLTSTEFDLLCFLLHHQGQALSREELLREVWGYQQPVYSRTVDTHVQRLRDKLGPCRDQLETVRGVGYRLNRPVTV